MKGINIIEVKSQDIDRVDIVWLNGLTMDQWYAKQTDKPKYMINASLWDNKGAVGTIYKNGACIRDCGNGYGLGVRRNEWGFTCPWDTDWTNYITGYPAMVKHGFLTGLKVDQYVQGYPNKRSFVGMRNGNLILGTEDGVTVDQLAALLFDANLTEAINLDGGGSSRLYVDGKCINKPTDNRRCVNIIAVYMKSSKPVPEPQPPVTPTDLEAANRKKVVNTVKSWVGSSEANGGHKTIIDLYNNHKPLAQGYKVKYTDAWCATTVSAVSIACGFTAFMPTECSCPRMVKLYQALGRWVEDDAYVPKAGDIVLYDWQDSGVGDCTGDPEHVGIVIDVNVGKLTIAEGNYKNAVSLRTLSINGRYIRGYCVPDYAQQGAAVQTPVSTAPAAQTTQTQGGDTVAVTLPVLKKGANNNATKSLQQLLIAKGYPCTGGADGQFGAGTQTAVKRFQTVKGLGADGVVGEKTWAALLTR